MRFIVTLYKEGDPMDGETFACGTYNDEADADGEAAILAAFGQTQVLPLWNDASEIEEALS